MKNEITSIQNATQIILMGDFNFPTAKWIYGDMYFGGNHPQLKEMKIFMDQHYLM